MLCIFELTLFPPPLLGVGGWGVGLCAAAPQRPPDDSSVPPLPPSLPPLGSGVLLLTAQLIGEGAGGGRRPTPQGGHP